MLLGGRDTSQLDRKTTHDVLDWLMYNVHTQPGQPAVEMCGPHTVLVGQWAGILIIIPISMNIDLFFIFINYRTISYAGCILIDNFKVRQRKNVSNKN